MLKCNNFIQKTLNQLKLVISNVTPQRPKFERSFFFFFGVKLSTENMWEDSVSTRLGWKGSNREKTTLIWLFIRLLKPDLILIRVMWRTLLPIEQGCLMTDLTLWSLALVLWFHHQFHFIDVTWCIVPVLFFFSPQAPLPPYTHTHTHMCARL